MRRVVEHDVSASCTGCPCHIGQRNGREPGSEELAPGLDAIVDGLHKRRVGAGRRSDCHTEVGVIPPELRAWTAAVIVHAAQHSERIRVRRSVSEQGRACGVRYRRRDGAANKCQHDARHAHTRSATPSSRDALSHCVSPISFA